MIFRRADKDKLSKSYLIGWALYELRGHDEHVVVPSVDEIILKAKRLANLSSITAEPVHRKDVLLNLERKGLRPGDRVRRERYISVSLEMLGEINPRLERLILSRIEHDLEYRSNE